MTKEEYLNAVLEQIRCTKAHDMIREELSQHIDDQMECYEEYGMEKDEAVLRAVERMGSPVETGVELDRVHRPKFEWRMLVFVGVLCVIGLLIQFSMNKMWEEQQIFSMKTHLSALGIGAAVMFAVYFLDYTFLIKHARTAAVIFFGIGLLHCVFGVLVNGCTSWLFVPGGIVVDLLPFLYLYVPVYAALLYQYRDGGYRAVLKSVIAMLPPLLLAWHAPSLPTFVNLLYIQAVVLSIAVAKDWFQIRKKAVLGAIWAVLIVAPLAGAFYLVHSGAESQAVRILGWLGNPATGYQADRILGWMGKGSEAGQNFVLYNTRQFLESSQLFGKCDAAIAGAETGVSSILLSEQMIFTHIIGYYGVLAGMALTAVIVFFIWKMLSVAAKQKNQAGMLVGAGSAIVFAVQFLQAVLENLSFLPTTSTYFPLLSHDAGSTVVSFLLLGLLMSVYRYQNIVPPQPVKERRWKLKLKLMLLP